MTKQASHTKPSAAGPKAGTTRTAPPTGTLTSQGLV
jgi:hypothetical protein